MNGPHDMGGEQNFGPVIAEQNEPIFHGDWEKKALALTVAMGFTGAWNIDISRQARESIPPADYLSFSYYEIWLAGLEKLILQTGLVTSAELESGSSSVDPKPIRRTLVLDEVDAALAAGGPANREADRDPAFKAGDGIMTRNINPKSHTRLPSYARKARGIIDSIHGCHVFPDSNAVGEGENPQWLYSVRFTARELFGADAEANHEILIDCWEPYLEHT